MDLNELNQLDLNSFGEWPLPAKAVVILVACIGLGGLAYYLDTQDQLTRLERARASELELRTSFETKQRKAVNLEAYRKQLAEMKESFGAMLRQLPNKTEVVMLEAQLLGIEELDDAYMASVEFSGLIREDASTGPNPFREVWNITRPKNGPGGWLVAGVQALQ